MRVSGITKDEFSELQLTTDSGDGPVGMAHRELVAEAQALELLVKDAPAYTGFRYIIPFNRWTSKGEENANRLGEKVSEISQKYSVKPENDIVAQDIYQETFLFMIRYV